MSIKDDFSGTFFLIEANSYEMQSLWAEYSNESLRLGKWNRYNWHQISMGKTYQLGTLDGRPINVAVFWAIINERKVAFYYGCSQLVDHALIEKWWRSLKIPKWDRGTRLAHCDASNFHHCINAIDDLNSERSGYA
jgi:hypothetical protein